MVGAGVGGLENNLFFYSGRFNGFGWGKKNLIFRLKIEARRRESHLERKNRSAVEDG